MFYLDYLYLEIYPVASLQNIKIHRTNKAFGKTEVFILTQRCEEFPREKQTPVFENLPSHVLDNFDSVSKAKMAFESKGSSLEGRHTVPTVNYTLMCRRSVRHSKNMLGNYLAIATVYHPRRLEH
jgi:hypothetical protein